ncbi:uncharacterized protein DS421_6g173690 [Arachis hypogaea]|nr:uncharacterized protein DS421_6g173690 [Arachis hypogaea]
MQRAKQTTGSSWATERRRLGRLAVAGAYMNGGDTLHGWVDRQRLPSNALHGGDRKIHEGKAATSSSGRGCGGGSWADQRRCMCRMVAAAMAMDSSPPSRVSFPPTPNAFPSPPHPNAFPLPPPPKRAFFIFF